MCAFKFLWVKQSPRLHRPPDCFRVANVLQWIRVEQDKIGQLTLFNRAEIWHAQYGRSIPRCNPKDLAGGQASLDKARQFPVQRRAGKAFLAWRIRAREQLHTQLMGKCYLRDGLSCARRRRDGLDGRFQRRREAGPGGRVVRNLDKRRGDFAGEG